MAFTEMSLPIDIPWKRMGVSKDMIDPKVGDLKFPEKWRSSISVFYHEPPELPPEYCNRKITYLKVVCTITNYQPAGQDVTILDVLRKGYEDFFAWRMFDARVTQSFPCYGALMQVAVFPKPDEGVELHDFPYISSFQPRKREMYEIVTESGEIGSQSATKVNIGKRMTSTNTLETYDVDQGWSYGGSDSVLWGLSSGSRSKAVQGQWGTIDRNERQDQQVTTTDASREKRESHSYTTNINQLYSLLQGYHLGTNRALFFMQPRPHIQSSKFSFIRGLRRLEGIQEFFLIVNRPASVPGFCVEIALETAHAYLRRAYKPRLIPLSDLYAPGNLNKTAAALGLNLPEYAYYTRLVNTWNSFFPWVRQEAHEAIEGPPIPLRIKSVISRGGMTQDDFSDLRQVVEKLPEIGTEQIALIFEEYESDAGYFFVTGRRLRSCVTPTTPQELEDDEDGEEAIPTGEMTDCEYSDEAHISTCDEASSIVYWNAYDGNVHSTSKYIGEATQAIALNSMVNDLNETLWASLNSNDRYPYGKVSFTQTDFVLEEMSQLIRLLESAEIEDRPLAEIESIQPFIEKGLGRVSGVKSVLELGSLPTELIARDLNVTLAEARGIRRDLMVISLDELDATSINNSYSNIGIISQGSSPPCHRNSRRCK